ncbi:MAG TPA: PH domain-containing protein [Bacillota bacterium]|jgi:hypothetical protein|nr:PH domain-containing protein [Bacillota bacterium]HOL11159.1 PH domain-containing protein [Bacillota bacterium]HPO98600.1 PH domain-containing protein [Bacillota bacterium]
MPYCSECGSSNNENNQVCSNCGIDLIVGYEPKCEPDIKDMLETASSTVKHEPEANLKNEMIADKLENRGVESKILSEKNKPQDENLSNSNRHRVDEESHLGKGLIKPTKVEVGIDGYHFTFDKPQTPAYSKKDSASKNDAAMKEMESVAVRTDSVETVVENPGSERLNPALAQNVTKPDQESDSETVIEALEPEVVVELDESVIKDTVENTVTLIDETKEILKVDDVEEDVAIEIDEVAQINVEEVKEETDQEIVIDDSIQLDVDQAEKSVVGSVESNETLEKGPTETQNQEDQNDNSQGLVSESEVAESKPSDDLINIDQAQLGNELPDQIFLEGRQTWYGVPLPNVYQITNKSIILLDQNSNQTIEYKLDLITGVSLKQNWLTRWLGIGDLIIDLQGGNSAITLKGIIQPKKTLKVLEELLGEAI